MNIPKKAMQRYIARLEEQDYENTAFRYIWLHLLFPNGLGIKKCYGNMYGDNGTQIY